MKKELTLEEAREIYQEGKRNDRPYDSLSMKSIRAAQFRLLESIFGKENLEPKLLVRSLEEAYQGGFEVTKRGYNQHLSKGSGYLSSTFKTIKQFKSAEAFARLSHIVADANGDWEADWSDLNQRKYCIISRSNNLIVDNCFSVINHLPIKSEEIAKACLEMHEQLWKYFLMVD